MFDLPEPIGGKRVSWCGLRLGRSQQTIPLEARIGGQIQNRDTVRATSADEPEARGKADRRHAPRRRSFPPNHPKKGLRFATRAPLGIDGRQPI